MRIETGFRVTLSIAGAIFAAAIFAFGYNQFVISDAVLRNAVADAIATDGMELAQLTNEVLLYGEARAIDQWRVKIDEVTHQVTDTDIPLHTGARGLVARVALELADMRPLFERVVRDQSDKLGRERGVATPGDILSEQLFKKTVLLQTSLRTLKTSSEAELKAVYDGNRNRMMVSFSFFMLVSFFFSIAVSQVFRRAVLMPIQELDNAIRDVNAGDDGRRAEVRADDEIGVVCNAFNRLLDQEAANTREIEFLAFHDALTGLPNRALLMDRLKRAISYAERSGDKVALLFLDLDNFKLINDTLGHMVGDELLKSVAARLRQSVRDTDTVSRQGGDEFVVVVVDVADAEDIAATTEKLLAKLSGTLDIGGHEIPTSGSIGISIYPDDTRDPDILLKNADTALYEAKSAGRNTYRFFAEHMNVEASQYLKTRHGLQRALDRGEFVLYYQPQVDLATGQVIAAEALIRWRHPEQGLVPPGRFIPVAEDSGLIVPIGAWVLREACRQIAAWDRAGLPAIVVAVNLSAVQFKRDKIDEAVARAIADAGIEPSRLELELTESLLISDTENVLTTVRHLKAIGVQLSIDDFGTGYSSLSYLKRFRVDKLKIDQSFVRDLASDPESAAIVQAIIQMAHSLNLRTVAEGVETAQMLEIITRYQCNEAQGYHFSRPVPAEEFAAYLMANRRREGSPKASQAG